MKFDLLIRNGSVLDGTGAEAIRADLGIFGDHFSNAWKRDEARAVTPAKASFSTSVPSVVKKSPIP